MRSSSRRSWSASSSSSATAAGTIDHVNDWGRRKITFPMEKRPDGRYVIITCTGEPASLPEIERVLSINKGVVLRALFIRLNRADAERAKTGGAPAPVDTHPEGEARPQRGGRPGGARRRPPPALTDPCLPT